MNREHLRKVEVLSYEGEVKYIGYFHQFIVKPHRGEFVSMAAIVEKEDGTIVEVSLVDIRFIS